MQKSTNKSFLFAATASLALLSAPIVLAADTQERIVQALNEQGFSVRKVKRTWLGRVRIEAAGGGLIREVVFNPSTGEILRDFWEPERLNDRSPGIVLANPKDDAGKLPSAVESDHDEPAWSSQPEPEHEQEPEREAKETEESSDTVEDEPRSTEVKESERETNSGDRPRDNQGREQRDGKGKKDKKKK